MKEKEKNREIRVWKTNYETIAHHNGRAQNSRVIHVHQEASI
jgi:hypothetical protein